MANAQSAGALLARFQNVPRERLARLRFRRETALHLAWIVVFVCAAFAALVLALRAGEAQNRVKDTLLVRAAAQSLTGALRDAEASQRNYLLSGDEDYLLSYGIALIAIPGHQRQLRELGSPSVARSARLDELDQLIDQKIAQLQRTLEIFDSGDREKAIEAVELSEAKQTLSAIRALVAGLNEEENRLLLKQEQKEHRLRLLLLGALVASIAAALWLAWLSVRDERRTAAVLAGMNKVLEVQVSERTALLESERRRVEGLLSDMTHRVGNSLSLISSMLALQARRSHDPALTEALMSAHERVVAVASAQRRLRYAADYECVNTRDYLDSLLNDLRLAMAVEHVSLTFHSDEVELSGHDAIALGIIVNELVTNALKHAFASDEGGEIAIRLRAEPERIALEVSDDGVGLSRSVRSAGLGTFVLQSMVKSLDGEIVQTDLRPDCERPGSLCRLTFPYRAPSAERRQDLLGAAVNGR